MVDIAEVVKFIVSLSENPAQARKFKADPDAVMEDARLSPETRSLLLSEPLAFLREMFLAAAPVVQTTTNTITNTVTNVAVTTTTNVNKHTMLTVIVA
jgi:hypothetical protein